MTAKIEYRKDYKHLYMPKTTPEILDVPSIPFVMLDGSGDPNGAEYGLAVEALYSLSYAVKMSYKSEQVPEGYYDYTVFPLEGIWDLVDPGKPSTDKNNLKYTIMIRQPDFLTEQEYQRFLDQVKKKKDNPFLDRLRFQSLTDGWSCQMMHLGPFEDEPASFARMEEFCAEQGYERLSKLHREIYLSDPRKTEGAKMKTVLRFSVGKKG
ncbi:hypothetical protein B9G55_24095 [Saccharibacillus sp. O16]|nr:hypothetical protein B9G55_24095 [Saccharibacillus sp. O16]